MIPQLFGSYEQDEHLRVVYIVQATCRAKCHTMRYLVSVLEIEELHAAVLPVLWERLHRQILMTYEDVECAA